jgi:hypothetical protein
MKNQLFFLFFFCIFANVANSQTYIKDKTFDKSIKNLYNPSTSDAGWSSYSAYPTTGTPTFTSSIITETDGNKYYQCITTTTSNIYQRALAQYTAVKLFPAKYKLTFRARSVGGNSFYLKLSTQTAAGTAIPANLAEATSGITLSSNLIYITPTTTWQTYSCVFELMPAAEDYFRVFFTFDKIGTFELDDIDLFPYGNIPVNSISITSKPEGLNTITTAKGTVQLFPVIMPTTATYRKVAWTVSDSRIASVSAAGIVTAIQNGTVTAFATSLDGTNIVGSYDIVITNNPLVQKVTVSGQNGVNVITTAGGTLQMLANVLPVEAAEKRVVWSVDKPTYATIDGNGLVTAKVNGKVAVTATAVDLSGAKGTDTITISGNAEYAPTYRLATRFTFFYNDSLTTYNNNANWTITTKMRNGASYNSTTTAGDFVQYTPNLLGISGSVDVLIYKNTSISIFDTRAKIEIFHNGKVDVVYTNLNSVRDDYYSVGQFDFNADGTEYIRIVRETTSVGITPALPIRLDVYYDTQCKPQTNEQASANVPNGYTQTGVWRNSTKPGYRTFAIPSESNTAGSTAIWKPGNMDAGKYMIYAYRPNIKSNDRYEIFHDSKVDIIYLNNLKQSNLNLDSKNGSPTNPMADLGWCKLGVFDFSGTGNEYVRLTKNSTDTTFNDCLMFENVKFEGTILRRTVVTTNPYSDGLFVGSYPATFELKEAAATIAPGLSVQGANIWSSTSGGMYSGSTVYSREYVLKKGAGTPHYINPLITEPGEYELSLYAGYPPGAGSFIINTGAGTKSYSVASFPQYKFTTIGKATFNGGLADEYIQMNIGRFADVLLEKNISNGAILKQVAVTAFPYYKEKIFTDTKGIPAEHDISVMVKKGFMTSVDATTFAPNTGMTRADFITSLVKIVGLTANTNLPTYSDVLSTDAFKGYIGTARQNGLLYGLPDTSKIYPNQVITREVAAQLMLNAMEYAGRYTNVRNLFKANPTIFLLNYADASSVSDFAREAMARMTECKVLQNFNNKLLPKQILTRANVATLLKEFKENILGSGPTYRKCDWQLTFFDEFEGNQLDFNKWGCDDYVRFAPYAAKWKENCKVEDGMFKGYNYLDNHKVPYSSGNISSKFSQNRGFFEARYKYPKCFGSHTSFWSGGGSVGDNNYNEGAYPNSIGTNNYFLKEPYRSQYGFQTEDNLSSDFHTNGGYTGEDDIFYVWDGKPYGIVKPLSDKWNTTGGATTANYAALMSTVISFFDGPLDRDQIDGTYAACDWVRVYKEVVWLPELQPEACLPINNAAEQPVNVAPVLKFNKAMNLSTLTASTVTVNKTGGGIVPTYRIIQMTPLRFKVSFNRPLEFNSEYQIIVKSAVNDLFGNAMVRDSVYTFKTQAFSVVATSDGPVEANGTIHLTSQANGGSGTYTSYQWVGPNGFTSTDQNPVVANATQLQSGIYKVTITDNNGGSSSASVYVTVLLNNGIDKKEMSGNLSVYPIPTKGIIIIEDDELAYNKVEVKVVNMTGQTVYTDNIETSFNRFQLDLMELKTGFYFLNIKAKGKNKCVKIMINK